MSSAPFSGLRVVLVAKFDPRYHHTGTSIRAALEQLGCDVLPVDLRDQAVHRWLGRRLPKRLRAAIVRHRPDVVLSYKGGELEPALVYPLKPLSKARWINWFPDSPHNLELSLQVGEAHDHSFLFDSYMVDRHRSLGRKADFLPLGVDPDRWRPVSSKEDAPLPIVFVGTTEPLRDAALARVADLGLRCWGPERPEGPLYGDALAQVYTRAIIALNVHQFFGEPAANGRYGTGANQRVFELAGIGTAQLVDAKADIQRSFVPDREIVLFRTGDELRERAIELLGDIDGTRAIGRRARDRALSEHTWRHRLDEMLTTVLR